VPPFSHHCILLLDSGKYNFLNSRSTQQSLLFLDEGNVVESHHQQNVWVAWPVLEVMLRDSKNITAYIHDPLAHTATHNKHLEVLEKLMV